MATWLGLILSVLKLLGTLASVAEETRREGEDDAAALGRVLDDAQRTIDQARKARAGAEHAARTGGLLDDDGHRRD